MEVSDKRRAQMHTLEGLAAAMIIIIAAFHATQAVAITPTSSSTASKAAEAELKQVGDDVLAQAHSNGDLKRAILQWDETRNQFHGADSRFYTGHPPDNEFGETLERVFDDRGIAYNIDLHYMPVNDVANVSSTHSTTYMRNGDPTDNSVVVSQKLVLRDEDVLYDSDGDATDTALVDEDGERNVGTYPINGFTRDPGSEYRDSMYNVVEVRMVIWRS